MARRVSPSHPSDMTAMDWAKIIMEEAQWYRTLEKNAKVQHVLYEIEKQATVLRELCRKLFDTTPTTLMALFKDHLTEEMSKVFLESEGLGYIKLETQIGKRAGERLPPGRMPHFSEYRIGIYRKDAEGKDPVAVAHIPVIESDDPGINIETLLPLVCLWMREYAEKLGLGVKFEHKMEAYAEQL